MNVPLRRDSENGLTIAQFDKMPSVISKRTAKMKKSTDPQEILDAAQLEADIPVWEAASKQLKGEDGKWSITWSKVNSSSMKESDDVDDELDPETLEAVADAIEEAAEGEDVDVSESDVEAASDALDVAIEELGARNSAADSGVIQTAHDAMVKLGATCGTYKESLVEFGEDDPEDVAYNESGWGELEQVTFAEADPIFDDENREVTITPIRPGRGNKKDKFFYPAKTIREAVEKGRFNGVKMYANHPTKTGERELPERSVSDWVGVIKETTWDEQHSRPRSRLKVLDEGVWRKFREAPEHIAYSVLGGGRARRGRVDGEDARIVESMDKVRSVDWVTEAGAGGGITFAESADEEFDMDINELTLEQVKEGNPDLFAAIREADIAEADGDDAAKPKDEAAATPEDAKAATPEKAVKDEAKPEAKGTKSGGDAGKPTPDGFVSQADFDALKKDFDAANAKVEKAETKEADEAAADDATDVLKESLKESLLPQRGQDFVTARFAEATIGEGYTYADADAMKEAVATEITAVKALTAKSGSSVTGLGSSADEGDKEPTTMREAKEASLMDRILSSDDLPEGRKADEVPESLADKADDMASRI